MFVSLEDFAIAPGKHLRGNRLLHRLLDLALRGPDIGEVDGVAVFAFAQRIFSEVDIDPSGESKGNDKRRRHQIICANFGVDAALEVAIAGEDGSYHQFFLVDGLRYLGGQRAGVADAGGTSIADDVELQLFEIGHQAGFLQVVAHNF